MTLITDETLMAYADGELPRAERRKVMDELSHDPDLAGRLEGFIYTRQRLAPVLDRAIDTPIPSGLLALIQGFEQPRASARSDWASWMPDTSAIVRLAAGLRLPAWSPLAAAPALVLVLGLLFGAVASWLLNGSPAPREEASLPDRRDLISFDKGGLLASAVLQRALETTPAGSVSELSAEPAVTLKPNTTFFSLQQTWCREYELTYANESKSGGIGCRTKAGEWRIEVQTAAVSIGMYSPASGPRMLGDAVDKMMQGNPLAPAEANRLIKNGWAAR